MKFDLLGHLAYKIVNAPVQIWPFPHIYVRDVFPDDFYAEMLANLPSAGDYSESTTRYNGRQFADPTKIDIFSTLNTPSFEGIASAPFERFISKRFSGSLSTYTDLRLIRDRENYSIGPHTDAPWKILSYLFYLPPDSYLSEHGTSIYLPRDPSFRCPGGPHHPFDQFTRIATAPFEPNTLLAFFKTNYSFHGVEPITIPCQRDLLLWNLYDKAARNGKTS